MRENEVEHSPELARPFCFCVVVWGEQFENYFLEHRLPSCLLRVTFRRLPANALPNTSSRPRRKTGRQCNGQRYFALSNVTQNRFCLNYLRRLPISRTGSIRSRLKLYCEAVFQRKAYRISTVPDYLYADGTVARLNELATSGAQAVLINPQPRMVEEPFFSHSRKWEYCRTPIAVIPVRRSFISRASWFQPHSDRFIA